MSADRKVALWTLVAAQAAGDAVTVDHVCAAAVNVAGMDGVALSVANGSAVHEIVYASDAMAVELAELDQTLGQGPDSESFATGGPVLIADLTAAECGTRWPGYAPAAVGRGIRATFALPMRIGAIRLGVLTLHRLEPGGLDGEPLADVLELTETACLLLLDGAGSAATSSAEPLHPQVHQATGMVTVQLGVTVEVALIRLRAYAFATGRRLRDVADDVVHRRLRFDPEGN